MNIFYTFEDNTMCKCSATHISYIIFNPYENPTNHSFAVEKKKTKNREVNLPKTIHTGHNPDLPHPQTHSAIIMAMALEMRLRLKRS